LDGAVISETGNLFSQIGFPAAMCIFMLWYVNKTQTNHKDELKEVETAHREEMNTLRETIDNLKDTINNNTLVMQKFIDRLEMEDDLR